MIIASIDIGSNSVLLLIAAVNIKEHAIIAGKTYYETPRISEGISATGIINPARQDLLFTILKKYRTIIISERADKILVTATKAFRVARNAGPIVEKIKDEFGWDTKIISGDVEAKLTFLGTAYPFNALSPSHGVIDIGGGSTEVVIGNKNEITFKKSFDIGVVSVTERYLHNNPPTRNEIENATNAIDEIVSSLPKELEAGIFHSVAGTPTTLACIKLNKREFNEKLINDYLLQLSDISEIKNVLAGKKSEDILKDYGPIVEGREDVLLAGTLILERVMGKLGLSEISVSTRGLRFGVLFNELKWV